MRRALPILLLACASLLRVAHAEGSWPAPALPKDAQSFQVGEQYEYNGIPMRATAFVAPGTQDEVADWFRRSLGQPLVENRIGKAVVLGKADGEYYVTVQLEASGDKARGIVAVSHLAGMEQRNSRYHADKERWLQRLPAGVSVVRLMNTEDHGKRAQNLVLLGDQDEQTMRDGLVRLLGEDGLRLEHEARAAGTGRAGPIRGEARTLYFRGTQREGMATIARNREGRTFAVLNTVSTQEKQP